MIPGELLIEDGEIELNAGRPTVTLMVANTGDRLLCLSPNRGDFYSSGNLISVW